MSNEIDTQTKTLIEGITSLGTIVKVETDDDLKQTTSLLGSIKSNSKELKAKKSAALTPLKESIKEINSWFKPAEDHLASIEQSIKQAMLVYHEEKEAAARKEAERIERRIDKGTMKVETGIAKLAGINQADSNVQTVNGSAQFRQSAEKIRVTDPVALVKDHPELLMTERVLEALRMETTAWLKEGKLGVYKPAGIEVYRDKVVAGIAV